MAHFLVDQRAETEKTVLASCDESGVGNRWLSNLPIIIRSSALQRSLAVTCWILCRRKWKASKRVTEKVGEW